MLELARQNGLKALIAPVQEQERAGRTAVDRALAVRPPASNG
jgi:hypothetical protein